jgi:hypothetical protein
MRLVRRGAGLLLAGSTVVACQTPQPVYEIERSRTYGQSKEQIWGNVLRFLKENDISATRADFAGGSIDAERRHYQDAGWPIARSAGWSITTATRTGGGERERSIAIWRWRSKCARPRAQPP